MKWRTNAESAEPDLGPPTAAHSVVGRGFSHRALREVVSSVIRRAPRLASVGGSQGEAEVDPRSVSRNTNRLVAFSDAVFAITITLLVLEIRAPTADRNLLHALLALWPSYLAYAVTFLFHRTGMGEPPCDVRPHSCSQPGPCCSLTPCC